MMKKLLTRSPFVTSTVISIIFCLILIGTYFIWLSHTDIFYTYLTLSTIIISYIVFNIMIVIKKNNSHTEGNVETENNTLSTILKPLLKNSDDKPIYIILGNKNAGKNKFLHASNSIKPVDHVNSIKNDFFEWSESSKSIYLTPNHRLIFQENPSSDLLLWNKLIDEIILYKPRKPFAGCLFFIDFEFIIVNDDKNINYNLNSLLQRLKSIKELTGSTLPFYLIMTKLDKLEGFKEYINFSPLRSNIDYLSIPLKDAKGQILSKFENGYKKIIKAIESNALDASSLTHNDNEKQAILTFPKQFELCHIEILRLIERLNELNQGNYSIDIREVFFTSSLQGGRKYNLLAKSCSNYFNLPIIASEHSQLTETPYFSQFLIDSKILPEADFSTENQFHLKRIQQYSHAALFISVFAIIGCSYFLFQTMSSNLNVINQLIKADNLNNSSHINKDYTTKLTDTQTTIESTYLAWSGGKKALSNEILAMNVSKLDATTNVAYDSFIKQVKISLMPLIADGYYKLLKEHRKNTSSLLPLLKGYLMLNDPSKRDSSFLKEQTAIVLKQLSTDSETSKEVLMYLNDYFDTDFEPVNIKMDLVSSTRRHLLRQPPENLVYSQIINKAKQSGIGSLNLKRTVGFEFNNIFKDPRSKSTLNINKIYTSDGFSSFYSPHIDLLSNQVIADNWVLGLSENTIPSDNEQQLFKKAILKKYTDDYNHNWHSALNGLRIKRYNSLYELNNAISLLSSPSSPMTIIMREVYDNTKFSPDIDVTQLIKTKKKTKNAINIASKASNTIIEPDYVSMSRVEQVFLPLNQLQVSETKNSPTQWNEIIIALNHVRIYIKEIMDAQSTQDAAFEAARQRMSKTNIDPIMNLKKIAIRSPEPVRSWLMDIADETWSIIVVEASKGLQTRWYNDVYSVFNSIGGNKYPFNRSSREEISIRNFEKLFSRGGTFDSFMNNSLAPFYNINSLTPKQIDGQSMSLSPNFISHLKKYKSIRNMMINKDTNKFSIPFTAKVVDLDSSAIRAIINIGDNSMDYYHGPSKVRSFQWPPKNGDVEVKITLQDVTDEGKQHTLSINGQWAIYRLLNKSRLSNITNSNLVSNINVSGRDISILFTPQTNNNPFNTSQLSNFDLPKDIIN